MMAFSAGTFDSVSALGGGRETFRRAVSVGAGSRRHLTRVGTLERVDETAL
jgi:hypothetical protein